MRKGFTLIELLAVIVILVIIALIATPLILNTIDEAKKGAFQNAAYGIVEAAEISYATDILSGSEVTITYNNGNETVIGGNQLQYKGSKPQNGKIKINEKGEVAIVIHEGSYCAIKPYHLSNVAVKKISLEECDFSILIDDSGANIPKLVNGMTPIKWDSDNNEEMTTVDDYEWFNYDQKKWANAKTADGSYWVWIPRYAYKITSEYHSSTTGTIDVKFLRKNTNESFDKTEIHDSGYEAHVKDTSMYYFVHPSFQNEIDEYGFWVAKFEPTASEGIDSTATECSDNENKTDKTVKIIPNANPWRCIDIKNTYLVSLEMKNKSVYGWLPEEVDTHLMTNLEWGAVTYLSKSEYGAPSEIWNNSYNQYQTGCSASNVNSQDESTCIRYDDMEKGVKASTTYNIYGIYDMRGSTWERVMATYNNLAGYTGFSVNDVEAIDSIHITRYVTEDMIGGAGMKYDAHVYGDAMYETSNNASIYDGSEWSGAERGGWYNDYTVLPYNLRPWIMRGGYYYNNNSGGLFGFDYNMGNIRIYASFRPVASPLK